MNSNIEWPTPRHSPVKLLDFKEKKKILWSSKEKEQVTCKEKNTEIIIRHLRPKRVTHLSSSRKENVSL